jgi:hypothetical protein
VTVDSKDINGYLIPYGNEIPVTIRHEDGFLLPIFSTEDTLKRMMDAHHVLLQGESPTVIAIMPKMPFETVKVVADGIEMVASLKENAFKIRVVVDPYYEGNTLHFEEIT